MVEILTRPGDMDPLKCLNLHIQPDGDIVIWIGNPFFPKGSMEEHSVEFTTIGSGGGRSPHTFKALLELRKAIKEDNKLNPIYVKYDGQSTLISRIQKIEK